jgi:nuclear transport factor 2 (NTF2) superfamily protein
MVERRGFMTPEEIVKKAEEAYAAQDLDLVKNLFDPEVVVFWNGKKFLEGRDQVIEFERKNFSSWTDFKIKKTLRAASSDTIAVEWEGTFIDKQSGKFTEMYGGEFWKIRDDRLIEWRAYMG